MILVCKSTCDPAAPLFKGQWGQCPRNTPPFWRPWLDSKLSFCVITGNVCTHCTVYCLLCCKHLTVSELAERFAPSR